MCWRMRGRRRGLLRSCHQSSPRHNPSIFCAVSALSSVHLGRCDSLQANLESTLPTWNQGPGHSGVAAAKKKLEPTLRRPKTHPTPTPACECSKPAPGRRITSHHIQHLTSHPSFDASTCRAALDRRPWDALLPSAAVARRLLPTGRDPRHLLWYVLTPRPAPPEKESNAPRLTSVAPRPIPPPPALTPVHSIPSLLVPPSRHHAPRHRTSVCSCPRSRSLPASKSSAPGLDVVSATYRRPSCRSLSGFRAWNPRQSLLARLDHRTRRRSLFKVNKVSGNGSSACRSSRPPPLLPLPFPPLDHLRPQ